MDINFIKTVLFNNINSRKNPVFLFLLSLIAYILIAFMVAEWNPLHWSTPVRCIGGIIIASIITYALHIIFNRDYGNQ